MYWTRTVMGFNELDKTYKNVLKERITSCMVAAKEKELWVKSNPRLLYSERMLYHYTTLLLSFSHPFRIGCSRNQEGKNGYFQAAVLEYRSAVAV